MCISSGLQDKFSPGSWLARKQGYAGATNPANILDTRVEGAMGIGSGKTDTEERAIKMGINQQRAARQAERVDAIPGHVKSIAAMKARHGG